MRESCEATITLAGDLHARPAASLAIAAARFESSIALFVGHRRADAKSVLSVMGIGAARGREVRIQAEGPDATEAVETLSELLGHATEVGA